MIPRPWVLPGMLAAALMASGPVPAQPGTTSQHPLQRGFEAAWARQPEHRSAPLRRDASDAARQAARRWTAEAPSLDLQARTDRLQRNDGARELEAAVAVPLWWPGERAKAIALAEADATALDARLLAVRWKLAGQLRSAYWDQARAALDLQLAQARRTHARQLAEDVAKRLKAGDLARADGHQAEAALAAADAALAEAQAAAARVARQWQALTGLAPLQGDAFLPEGDPGSAAEPGPAHPALQELSTRAQATRRQRELAGAQSYAHPELTVGAMRERGTFGDAYGQRLVVGVRIPIGASSGSQARLAGASAEQIEAETTLALDSQRLAAEADAAREQVAALQAAAEAAERRARLAAESRGFFEKSFHLGQTDLPTRLRIDLEAFEAERQAARARIDLSAARSALRQALGLLPG